MLKFRKEKTQAGYSKHLKNHPNAPCPFCKEDMLYLEFDHWAILQNRFPYDELYRTHHLLVTKRHIPDNDLTPEEWKEYRKIKPYLLSVYHELRENGRDCRSIPEHYHMHLLIRNNKWAQ